METCLLDSSCVKTRMPWRSTMPEKIVMLATYSNPIDAEMVKNYLQNAGVTVFSAGAEAAGAFVGLDSAFANIELHVPQSQLQQALDELESFDEQESAAERGLADDNDDTAIVEGEADRPSSPVPTASQFRSGPPAEEFTGGEDAMLRAQKENEDS